MSPSLKVRTMSKISRDRAIENWCWKASSERDAICNHAWKILKYREWAKHKTAIPVAIGAYIGTFLGLAAHLIEESHWEAWPAALMLVGCYGLIGVVFYGMWRSIQRAEGPMYDWAEEWKDLIEERRAFRREEYEQDLPRRKF